MEAHTSLQLVREKFRVCQERAQQCQLKGKGVDRGVLWKYDFHALFGWMLCSNEDEPNAHVISDVKSSKGGKKKKKQGIGASDADDASVGVKELLDAGSLVAPPSPAGDTRLPSPGPLPAF